MKAVQRRSHTPLISIEPIIQIPSPISKCFPTGFECWANYIFENWNIRVFNKLVHNAIENFVTQLKNTSLHLKPIVETRCFFCWMCSIPRFSCFQGPRPIPLGPDWNSMRSAGNNALVALIWARSWHYWMTRGSHRRHLRAESILEPLLIRKTKCTCTWIRYVPKVNTDE